MEKNKVEIIKCESSNKKCYICNGSGMTEKLLSENKAEFMACKTCDGTGIFKDNHYILITEDDKGNKIAFPMDTIK